MAEFEDKLNSLLSDQTAMDQIMQMARSLMGGSGSQKSPPEQTGSWTPPSAPFAQAGNMPWGAAFQPGQGDSATKTAADTSWGAGQPSGGWVPSSPTSGDSSGGGLDLLSGLANIDPKIIAALLPVLRELGSDQNNNARQLLLALRPYLKPERQDKVERALQLARLFRVGKRFLLRGDRYV